MAMVQPAVAFAWTFDPAAALETIRQEPLSSRAALSEPNLSSSWLQDREGNGSNRQS